MAIPSVSGPYGLLPVGRHVASMNDLHATFVTAAPFTNERQIVFDAFVLWKKHMSELIPQGKIWVNGGFVTHKPWAAPRDIDVAILCKPEDLNALDPVGEGKFRNLMTSHGPGWRRQPMGDLVDAFYVVRGDVPQTLYWDGKWSGVTDKQHTEVEGLKKGYVEVNL